MKKPVIRIIAWLLIALLAASVVIPAFAAESARTVHTTLGDGLDLTQTNSLLNGIRRQQFLLDYTPGGSVQPLVPSSKKPTAFHAPSEVTSTPS